MKEAILMVANRGDDSPPAPPVVNVTPTIVVEPAQIPQAPAPIVTVAPPTIYLPDMSPTIEVNLPPQEKPAERIVNQSVNLTVDTLVVQASQVVLKVAKLEQDVEVALPDRDRGEAILCPDPPEKREIVFTRDASGNIISAKEV